MCACALSIGSDVETELLSMFVVQHNYILLFYHEGQSLFFIASYERGLSGCKASAIVFNTHINLF